MENMHEQIMITVHSGKVQGTPQMEMPMEILSSLRHLIGLFITFFMTRTFLSLHTTPARQKQNHKHLMMNKELFGSTKTQNNCIN